jgi:uncharacterized protein (DUF885 family)
MASIRTEVPRVMRATRHAVLRLALLATVAVVVDATPAGQAFAAANDATRLHAVFDEYWQWVKRERPEVATFVGDNRYDDRLTDFSAAAIERRNACRRTLLKRLDAFDARRLGEQDAVSLGIVKSQLALRARLDVVPKEQMPVAASCGTQLELAYLVKSTPFRSVRDYDRYLARLKALPAQWGQIEGLLREGQASGWMQHALAIQALPAQFDAWLRDVRWEMVRACRLVIDTGIHAFGWDRARALACLKDNSGIRAALATAEIDRCIVMPGQALGYKLGELRIKALSAGATAALGDRFDMRRLVTLSST